MEKLFYVTIDGMKITEKLTLKQIVDRFGNIKKLEASGYRIIAA